MTLVTADEINEFASHEDSRRLLPRIIGRLIADEAGVVGADIPTGVWRHGYDGIVDDAPGSPFVPPGSSVWEFSNEKAPNKVANRNLVKRTAEPQGVDPESATFVFVTMRHWKAKREWKQRVKHGPWKDVAALDSDDLARWLEANPRIHGWATRLIRGYQRSAVASSDLPADPANFVGRKNELETLAEHAKAGHRPRAALIWGLAGSGKTSLAVRAAHEMRDHFPDGCYYVDVAALGSTDPTALQTTMLKRLGFSDSDLPDGDDAIASAYRSEAHSRVFVVVLDNASSEDQARALVPGDSESLLMITSRSRLAGLDNVRRLETQPLNPSEGAKLIGKERGRPLSGSDIQTARRIVKLCGGLPLAVRIAARMAERTSGWNLDRVAARLDAEESRIRRLHAGDVAVQSVFNSAYEALPSSHKRVFRHACTLPGPTFTVGLLTASCTEDGEDIEDVLDDLVDSALLTTHHQTDCYQIHDLLRIFGQEQFVQDEKPDRKVEVSNRVIDWLLEGAGAARRQIWSLDKMMPSPPPQPDHPADPATAREWLDNHYANIVGVALRCHARGSHALAVTFVVMIADYSELRGLWRDLNHLAAVARASLTAIREKANPMIYAGFDASVSLLEVKVAWGLRDFNAALDLANTALENTTDPNRRGHALLTRSMVFRSLHRTDEAIQDIKEAQALFEGDTADEVSRNLALHNLGAALSEAGDPQAAITHLGSELEACIANEDQIGTARTMNTLALAKMRVGDVEEAERLLRKSIAISLEHNVLTHAGYAYNDLGLLLFTQSRFEEAYECHVQDLTYCDLLDDQQGLQQALLGIAHTLIELDNDRIDEVIAIADTVAEYALEHDEPNLRAAVSAVRGKADYAVGNFERADDCYAAAAKIYNSHRQYEELVGIRADQLVRAADAGRISKVEPVVRELLEELARAGQPHFQAMLTAGLAEALASVGDDDAVRQLLCDSTELLESTPLQKWLDS